MNEPYSDLQVDSQHQFPKYSNPSPYQEDAKAASTAHTYSDKIAREQQPYPEVAYPYPPYPQPGQQKRICGLVARTFWIVAAIIAIIVVAAAVGGGVAASLAGKNDSTKSVVASTSAQAVPAASTSSASSSSPSNSASSTSQSSLSTPSATSSTALITSAAAPITTNPSTTTPDSISTSTTIGPSETLLVDCPSSNNTLYTAPSTSQTFQKICSNSLTSIGTNLNAVELFTTSLDGCIDACAAYNVQNATEISGGESNICNVVCWRATITGDDYPGVCFGFTTVASGGSFVYGGDDRCDSAALVSQSS